jgi:hypothetical protein
MNHSESAASTPQSETEFGREQRLALSYLIFSDPAFRERLLTDPTAAAAERGIRIPPEEHAELLHYREGLRAYGQAIDKLVSVGKDIRKLWEDPNIALCGINSIAAPGDWDPNYPNPAPAPAGARAPGLQLVRSQAPAAFRRRRQTAQRRAATG